MLTGPGATRPGRMRTRLVLEKPQPSPDGGGGATTAWLPVATVAADIRPQAGAAAERGEGVVGEVTHRIVIRHRGDVANGDRFRLDTRIFAVEAAFDPREDGRYLVCLAVEEGR